MKNYKLNKRIIILFFGIVLIDECDTKLLEEEIIAK